MMYFIKEYVIDNLMYIQIIPTLVGIICYTKLKRDYKWFVWVLIYSVANELFKQFYCNYLMFSYNRIWTNIYNVVYFSFIFWLFYKNINSSWLKKIIPGLVSLYFLCILIEVFIYRIDYNKNTQIIPYIIGGTGVIIGVFAYLISILNLKVEINIFKDFLFWFVVAHFIYFLGFTPLKISENYFSLNNDFQLIRNVKIGATSFKSLFLSIGFVWTTYMKKKL